MNHTTLILSSLSFIILVLILFYILRAVSSLNKKKSEEKERAVTEVGFVVDTFHDVVSKLKDKEKELELLRKRAETRASEIEIYNEDILQSVPSGVVSFDQKLCLTRMNAAAERILDCHEHEVAAKPYTEIFTSPLCEIIAGRQTLERTDIGYTTNTGKRIWLGLNMSPLKDSTGVIIGQILVFTDLTELKAFQSQMELRERLANLGEMSAGIAHELRNPMAVISGYTKILSRKAEPGLLPAVEAIAKEITVMDRIITDFLAFARPTKLVLTEVCPSALMEVCIRAVENSAGGIAVSRDFEAVPSVQADEVLLRQALINLLQNALEAMPEGGALRAVVRSGPDSVVMAVSDSGHGIPPELQEKIFLPFFTTKERGTGLGLSIVHKVVVSHGGSLSIDSSEAGTTISLSLPQASGG